MDWRKIFACLSIVALTCFACCPAAEVTTPETPVTLRQIKRDTVRDIREKTVALVQQSDEGNFLPYCSGVWVGQIEIVTALHCVVDEDMNVTGKVIYRVSELDKVGGEAVLKYFDFENDLVLLSATGDTTPSHGIATLASEAWQGQNVMIVGHTGGLWWTYTEGVVSSIRTATGDLGNQRILIQVSGPIWYGNSGGGVWDEKGRLLGISSMISGNIPNVGFFIHFKHINDIIRQ